MELRSYQQQDKENIYAMWSWGFKYVLYTLPPGGGKTVVFSSILKDSTGISVVIAHRLEILSQISRALAINKVLHSLIGPEKLNRIFKKLHREELGRSWIASNARVYVASVDTLKARISRLKDWGVQISLWVQDEAHHVLNDNKWGEVTRLFPNARGLGVTATPLRADKRSLKLGKGGVFQKLIIGPDYRTLIDQEYLTDYHIFAPLSNIDIKSLRITKSGDFNKLHLTSAARKSRIVGDVVTQYLKIAPGEQGATFVTDVKTAKDLEGQFRLQGVPAVALSAKSTIKDRVEAFRAFKDKKLLQLLNVDLFGEGVDLPALQFVCFARPTASYGLYCQQFGRVLRPYKGKTHGKIIDHVGNVNRHRLPDRKIIWNLEDGYAGLKNTQDLPLRTCERCIQVWEGYTRECPFCGCILKISNRSLPEYVEGDLFELDANTLQKMRNEIDRIDAPVSTIIRPWVKRQANQGMIYGLAAKHRKRQSAQNKLRTCMALWGGYVKNKGFTDAARYIRFYREFGIDVLTAQTLGRPAAEELIKRINVSINNFKKGN